MKALTLGQRIRAARKAAALSQEELGERIGRPKNSISEWERDLRTPNIRVLTALADTLGITIDDLVRGNPLAGVSQEPLPLPQDQLQAVKQALKNAANLLKQGARESEGRQFDTLVESLSEVRFAARMAEVNPRRQYLGPRNRVGALV